MFRAMQVFPPSVSNRGRSPFRETPRLWEHVAPSRKRRLLAGCHHSTGPQRVNTCWTSARNSCNSLSQTQHSSANGTSHLCFSLWIQVGVQTLPRDSEGPRRLRHWRGESCRCIIHGVKLLTLWYIHCVWCCILIVLIKKHTFSFFDTYSICWCNAFCGHSYYNLTSSAKVY